MTLLTIDIEYLAKTLKSLLEIPSPTGYTDELARFVSSELEELGVFYEVTRRGAIRARLDGAKSKPARAFVAHLDTLGCAGQSAKR
jgi:putative aminopeptidase FrvX